MSMNIHIQAERSVIVKETGSEATQTVNYEDEWQTPTNDSWDIYGPSERTNEERLEAYCQWALNQKWAKYRRQHVADLRRWAKLHRKCGFEVKVFVW